MWLAFPKATAVFDADDGLLSFSAPSLNSPSAGFDESA
jgi:hypothetical protein